MENLTWRMMAVSMRKHRQQMQNRYGLWHVLLRCTGEQGISVFSADTWTMTPTKEHNANRVSSINQVHEPAIRAECAQRHRPAAAQSSEQTAMLNNSNPEPMNIDDFIFSDNAATPVGIPMSPQPASKSTEFQTPAAGGAHAIPIKSRKDQSEQQQQHQFVPQSVPEPPHRQNVEFNYVKRHPRKTSIDERRVSFFFLSDHFFCCGRPALWSCLPLPL